MRTLQKLLCWLLAFLNCTSAWPSLWLSLACSACLPGFLWLWPLPLAKAGFWVFFTLLLSIYDWHQQSFPFIFWFIPTICLTCVWPANPIFWCLVALAVIARQYLRSIGPGDFLFLATAALLYPFFALLWVLQVASLLGFVYCLLSQKKRIPFVPFLSLASYIVFFWQ